MKHFWVVLMGLSGAATALAAKTSFALCAVSLGLSVSTWLFPPVPSFQGMDAKTERNVRRLYHEKDFIDDYWMGPFLAPAKTLFLAGDIRFEKVSYPRALYLASVRNISDLSGHVALLFGFRALRRTVFTQSTQEFVQATPHEPPVKSLLFITAKDTTPHKTAYLTGYNPQLRERFNEAKVTVLEVESPEDLVAQLKALPKNTKFDWIEIALVGTGGNFKIGDETVAPHFGKDGEASIAFLENFYFEHASPDATLMLCIPYAASRPLVNLSGKDPLDLARAFGTFFLTKGGTVIASPKGLEFVGFYSHPTVHDPEGDKLVPMIAGFSYLLGLGPLLEAYFTFRYYTRAWRNPLDMVADRQEVEIRP